MVLRQIELSPGPPDHKSNELNGTINSSFVYMLVGWLWFNVTFSYIMTGQLSSFQCRPAGGHPTPWTASGL